MLGPREGSSSLSGLPPADPEVKEQEKLVCAGDEVIVKCEFYKTEDASDLAKAEPKYVREFKVKEGSEVKIFKVMLANELETEHKYLELRYEGKVLIDPISLVDGWGENPPHRVVQVIDRSPNRR